MKKYSSFLVIILFAILFTSKAYSQSDGQANNYKIYLEALSIDDSKIVADYKKAIEMLLDKCSKEKLFFEKSDNKEIRYGSKVTKYSGANELYHFVTSDKNYWLDIIICGHPVGWEEMSKYFRTAEWKYSMESTGISEAYFIVQTDNKSATGVYIITDKIIFNVGINIPFGISDYYDLNSEKKDYLDKKQKEIYKIIKILKDSFVIK